MGDGKQVSILDVVGKLQQFQKDLEYVNALKEKLAGLADRFPMIYNGVTRQIDFFQRKIDELKGLTVAVPDVQVFEATQAPPADPATPHPAATETQELPSRAAEGPQRATSAPARKKVGKRR